jgi:hypothetical protein
MEGTRDVMRRSGLPIRDLPEPPASRLLFADGGQYRIEIPSTEGSEALQVVIEESAARDVPIHRVSQGSGIMLQTDDELRRLKKLGDEHGIEVSLFTGPRARPGTSASKPRRGRAGRLPPHCGAPINWCTASRTSGTPVSSG